MKPRSLFVLFVIVPRLAMGDVAVQEMGPREDLLRSGSKFLREEATADQFLLEARKLREQQEFSEEEKTYLEDLTAKAPARDQDKLCPTRGEGLCAPNSRPSILRQSFEPHRPESMNPSMDESPPSPTKDSSWIPWVVAAGLLLAAGAVALKDKEIQFSPR